MTPGSPKPEADVSLSDGASEPEAARKVNFEPDRGAGGGSKPKTDEPPDAAEIVGAKRRDGEKDEDKAPAGAVSPEKLSTESDDGVS